MNITELALYLKRYTKSQIYQMVHRDEIPYKNTGKELVFDKKKIDVWNKKQLEKIEKDKEYLSLQELITYLDPPLSKATIYQYKCEDKIPHTKIGKFLRFKRTEIDKWNDAGRPLNF